MNSLFDVSGKVAVVTGGSGYWEVTYLKVC